jgi:hypothetical protein
MGTCEDKKHLVFDGCPRFHGKNHGKTMETKHVFVLPLQRVLQVIGIVRRNIPSWRSMSKIHTG